MNKKPYEYPDPDCQPRANHYITLYFMFSLGNDTMTDSIQSYLPQKASPINLSLSYIFHVGLTQNSI